MNEQWHNFAPPWDGYKISNYGRIISPKGKELKPHAQRARRGKNYFAVICSLKIERKGFYLRKIANVAVEVYRHFGKGYRNGVKVYHKDGDKFNNRIDNLFISKGYTTEPTAEQLARVPDIKPCVTHALKVMDCIRYRKYGMDIDNVIGEAIYLCWLHLPQYLIGTSFYSFCKKNTKRAFLKEFKQWKKYGFVVSLEYLIEKRIINL